MVAFSFSKFAWIVRYEIPINMGKNPAICIAWILVQDCGEIGEKAELTLSGAYGENSTYCFVLPHKSVTRLYGPEKRNFFLCACINTMDMTKKIILFWYARNGSAWDYKWWANPNFSFLMMKKIVYNRVLLILFKMRMKCGWNIF